MEELKNTPVAVSEAKEDMRRPYEAPTAEIILLAPQEEMAAWTYHNGENEDANRWALNGWGYSALGDPDSGVYGPVTPNNWTLPTE